MSSVPVSRNLKEVQASIDALNRQNKARAQTEPRHGKDKEARLVAVSKYKPAPMLQEAFDAGQRHFGENYVQVGAEICMHEGYASCGMIHVFSIIVFCEPCIICHRVP